jgi:hypothetical protein
LNCSLAEDDFLNQKAHLNSSFSQVIKNNVEDDILNRAVLNIPRQMNDVHGSFLERLAKKSCLWENHKDES